MKKIRLSFGPTVVISFLALIADLGLLVINRTSLNVWGYFLFSGIIPIILLSFFNAFLLKANQLRKTILPLMFLSILETLIIMLVSNMIDLNQVLHNTRMSGARFSMSASVDSNVLGNFISTFFPIFGISLLIISITTYFSKTSKVREAVKK